jgi:hypothetical protein
LANEFLVFDHVTKRFGALTAVDDVTEYGTRTLYPSFGEEVRQVRRLLGGKRY